VLAKESAGRLPEACRQLGRDARIDDWTRTRIGSNLRAMSLLSLSSSRPLLLLVGLIDCWLLRGSFFYRPFIVVGDRWNPKWKVVPDASKVRARESEASQKQRQDDPTCPPTACSLD
jgi:hypothetical protein